MKTTGELELLPDGHTPAFSFPNIPRENRARIYYDYKRGGYPTKHYYSDGTVDEVNEFVQLFANNPADWDFTSVFIVYYYGRIAHWDISEKCWWVSDKSGSHFFETPIV